MFTTEPDSYVRSSAFHSKCKKGQQNQQSYPFCQGQTTFRQDDHNSSLDNCIKLSKGQNHGPEIKVFKLSAEEKKCNEGNLETI